ncbi:unnamed protein product, partial [Mesorhabditis spiculigera]
MWLIFGFVLAASACDLSKQANWPNGTYAKLHWWQCGGTTTYHSAVTQDVNGKAIYPIKLTEPLVVETDWELKNTFEKGVLSSIKLWAYKGMIGCDWSEVPTLGLLSNLDACEHGVPCPVKPGRQTTKITLDFTQFKSVIRLLQDNAPYQLQYQLHQGSNSACIMSQARAFTK